jgi:hypothetical protein
MPKVNAQEYQEKQARNLKASLPDIRAGINKVTESPTAKAANKKEKMRQNLNAAIDNGSWEAGLRKVSLEQWKEKALNKGVDRIASGIDGAKDKVISFAEKLLTYEGTAQQEIAKMPDLTLDDSINRATSWMRKMAKFKK